MKIEEASKYGANPAILEKLSIVGIVEFTAVQKETIKAGLCKGKSMVIAAPTSSGKTTIAEIAAVEGALKGQKTVYLVTHRALAEEKYLSFKAKYDSEKDQWFEVSIATGDHTEGEWHNGILVATYEKYLSILSGSGAYSVREKVVVADEIQILSDPARGPDIEILCTIIKKQKPSQFIALSATAPNINEIAGWFGCECINVTHRDVPLRQEIWYEGRRYYTYFGQDEILKDEDCSIVTKDTLQAVRNLHEAGFSPILVFTMTRRRAIELAELFSQSRQQDVKSYYLAEQLDLFSEPTTLSDTLKETSERKVAFHSADLSYSERTVVEEALRKRDLDVVFSTPTLAAGVNFPIRTVIFDSFTRFWAADPWLAKSEYINMSGRAGRLGLDDKGTAVLLAQDRTEVIKARNYISPNLENLDSTLLNKSIRKPILHLISIAICRSEAELNSFFAETFWWFQMEEHNPKKLEQIPPLISNSIQWHIDNGLVRKDDKNLYPTPLGIAISSTGLLPSTGISLLSIFQNRELDLSDSEYILPIIHAICASDEFSETHGQRFLPYARRNYPEEVAWKKLNEANLFKDPSQVENFDRVANAAYGIYLWAQGISERQLRRQLPAISYGQFHTLASDVAWILEGLARIVASPGIDCQPQLATKLVMLADRIRFGIPDEALDILKAAKAENVPGFGRNRAMALLNKGIADPNSVVNIDIEKLARSVENMARARALVDTITKYYSMTFSYWRNRHLSYAKEQGDDDVLIAESYDALGHEYEDKIQSMLEMLELKVKKLDVGKRQGVPDFLISYGNTSVLLECKTKKRNDATIDKDDAFEVLTKGADINANHQVTIGKPDFDSFSKSKAAGSQIITLVPHYAFVEAFLRYREGKLSTDRVFKWITTPGVATIDLLSC